MPTRKTLVIASGLVVLSLWLNFLMIWYVRTFGIQEFEVLVFHLFVPLYGSDTSFVSDLLSFSVPPALLVSALIIGAVTSLARPHAARILRGAAAGLLSLTLVVAIVVSDLPAYLRARFSPSDAIARSYVEPGPDILHPPDRPRNLIYLMLESMESSFLSVTQGGGETVGLIDELAVLAQENVHFSNRQTMGGAQNFPNLSWSSAGMVALTGGLPLRLPSAGVPIDFGRSFLPGARTLGDILAEQGYAQTILIGADARFAATDQYYRQHGGFSVLDYREAKRRGLIAQDYAEGWGIEDRTLYPLARQEIVRLSGGDRPFTLILCTADTHFPGFTCPICQTGSRDPYADTITCASRQASQFVAWIQSQPFYAETTIVISGDHISMKKLFFASYPAGYVRTVYQAIINPAPLPAEWQAHSVNRQFSTIDLFPTALRALGYRIDGNRLALGTDLFSGQPTLLEELGPDAYSRLLRDRSDFYDRTFHLNR